jgi:protein-S-isoprenylcysteine O-methyltransferase Ste14
MRWLLSSDLGPYGYVGLAFAGLWVGWLISWGVASIWSSRAKRRAPVRDELVYRVVTAVGAVLIVVQVRAPQSFPLLWVEPIEVAWALFGVGVLGIAFAWWARIHLGTLWSASVTRKDDHRVIDTGPYGIVRHPIYTGILTTLYAVTLAFPGPLDIAGAAVMTIGFVIKARLEERFLAQELGADAYEGYRRRVPMLVPFWPVSG